MIGNAYLFEDLQRISGYNRRADVERWATTNGVPFKYSRDGIWTTLEALNKALGLTAANDDGGAYRTDEVL